MRVRYSIVIALAALLALAGGATANTGFVAHLDGLQEVPPNTSPATGTGFFILDNTGTLMTWSVTYMNLTATMTASHLHASATSCPGTNAGVQLPLAGGGPASGSFSGSGAVNATLLTALGSFCGDGSTKAYINIHTGQFPGGEIRGQLFPDATPTHGVSWGRIKMLYR